MKTHKSFVELLGRIFIMIACLFTCLHACLGSPKRGVTCRATGVNKARHCALDQSAQPPKVPRWELLV